MSSFLVFYVAWPLAGLYLRADWSVVAETARDSAVIDAIWRSLWTALAATAVIALFGTPLAYLLARQTFRGKALFCRFVPLSLRFSP
jgi:ABC-type sulfate transport system permease component